MSKLRLSDLEYDLGRKQGAALGNVMLELISRGRSGRSIVARALDPEAGPSQLEDLIKERSGQVIEMVTESTGFSEDSDSLLLLGLLPGEELARKALAMWQRGERERAQELACLASEEGAALLVVGQAALVAGEFEKATSSFESAFRQGVSLEDVWHPWGEALKLSGEWPKASRLYEEASILSPAPDVLNRWADLVMGVLQEYRVRELEALGAELWELSRRQTALCGQLVNTLLVKLEEQARLDGKFSDDYLQDLIATWRKWRGLEEAPPSSDIIEVARQELVRFREQLLALTTLDKAAEPPALAAEKYHHISGFELVVDGDLPCPMVDQAVWEAAWGCLLESGDITVEVTAGKDAVWFTALTEGESPTPLGWQLATLVFRRHLGRLVPEDDGWQGHLLLGVPQEIEGEWLRAWLADDNRSIADLVEELGGSQHLWYGLHRAWEEFLLQNWAHRRFLMDALLVQLDSGLERLDQPSPTAEQVREWASYAERLTLWTRRYNQISHQVEPEYVDLEEMIKTARDRWMEQEGRGINLSTPEKPLPRLSTDRLRAELLCDVLMASLTEASTEGELILSEAPEEGAVRLRLKVTSPAAGRPFQERLLEQLTRELGVSLRRPEGGKELVLAFAQSSVEGELAHSVYGLERLDDQTRQALRAARALAEQEDADSDMIRFLLRKSVELEISERIWPHLERHLLLPAANRGWLSKNAPQIAAYLGHSEGRGFKTRCQNVENAIVKDRMAKGLEDLRNLAVALAGFTLTLSGERSTQLDLSEEDLQELARALYQCGEELSRHQAGERLFACIYRLLQALAVLPGTRH